MFMKTLWLLGFIALSALQITHSQRSVKTNREPSCYQNRCFYNNNTYGFFYMPLSYINASEICKTTGGQLAAIRDVETKNFISKMIKQAQFYGYWVDINYWQTQRDNNEMVAFSGWSRDVAKRGKSASGVDRCPYLSMALNLDWSDENCQNAQLPYICEYEDIGPLPDAGRKTGWACMKGGSCYQVIHIHSKLQDAKSDCARRGGKLALIAKRPTHKFLKKLIFERRKWLNFTDENGLSASELQPNSFDSWVGVHYVIRQWTSSDGTAAEYTNWLGGQPDWETENCVEIFDSKGKWNNLDCSEKRRYICEFHQETKSTTDCQDGLCYILVDTLMAHTDAISDCKGRGGVLTTVKSQKTNDFLRDLINKKPGSPRTWIGIRGSPGEFQYSDGTPLTFSDWDNGQPTNWKPNKNCAIANKNNNRWKNIDCAQKFRFICEYVEPDRCIPDMSNLPPELRLKLCLSQANSCLKLFSDVCECLKSFANACQQIFNDVCQEVFNHGRPDDKNC